jgi:phosphoglycolate phosphatase-like HAD superfamily hydrolase
MIKVVFLDFDGTVSDAKRIAYDSFVRTLDEFGYEFDDRKLRELMGTRMGEMLGELGIGDVGKIRRRFYKYFTEAALSGGIKPCVSLKPLREMREDYKLVVVSNSRKSFLRASIKVLGLKGLFDGVYGVDGGRSKDVILRKLFRKYKVKASEAIYVGDRFSDVDYAREAGCVAIAIHNKCSWSTLAKIKKEKPGFIVRDFYGLKRVLKKLEDAE